MIISILISIATQIIIALIKRFLNIQNADVRKGFQDDLATIRDEMAKGKIDANHIKALADLLAKVKAYHDA